MLNKQIIYLDALKSHVYFTLFFLQLLENVAVYTSVNKKKKSFLDKIGFNCKKASRNLKTLRTLNKHIHQFIPISRKQC